jgi:hypothetical protein
MLCAIHGEVAGADHDRELALEGVLLVRIARAGPRLELKVAEVQRDVLVLAGVADWQRQAPYATGCWPLLVESAATIAGENPLSISVSRGHGVLAVCESSGCVHCQLARLAISFARAIIRSRPRGRQRLGLLRPQLRQRPLLVRV